MEGSLRTFFITAYEFLLVALGFLYWGIVGISISLVSFFLSPLLPKKYSKPCGRFLLKHAFVIFVHYLKITGFIIIDDQALNKIQAYKGGAIIAPNHIALWDAVFIIAKIPESVCIMKGAILRNPVLGGGAKLAGYIPNDSTPQMLRAATEQVLQGEKLLLFPEGTRTKKHVQWINDFQGAAALIAKQTQAPIIPVYIRSDHRFFEKDNSLFNKPKFPLRISFEVGTPLYFSAHDTVKSFTETLQQNYLKILSKPHALRRIQKTRI